MDFVRPHILWALAAVPLVAFWIAWGARRSRVELERFTGGPLADSLAPGHSWRRNLLKGSLKVGALAMLVVALAGPRFGSQLEKVERQGIDIVVAVDVSLSMLAEDMLPNRLERAKQEIIDLIRGLRGDRVGVVVFAGEAFALCPLTVDYDAALMFTRSIGVDIVSEPGSDLSEALEKSAALFDESRRRDRAIIVVTDGESHEGDPAGKAAEIGGTGVRIFTIGIGNPAGELIPERGPGGSIEGYKKDRSGETVLTRLDEKTLQAVAAAANGEYLPATREGLELKVLYSELAGMERRTIQGEFVERRKDRFYVFLAIALAMMLLDSLVTSRASGAGRRSRRAVLHTGAAVFALVTVVAATSAHAGRVDRGKVRSGNEYYRAGEYDKALTLYREAIGDTLARPSGVEGVSYNEGNALYRMGRYPEAIDRYQRAFSGDSTLTGRMLYNRANALMKAEKLPEAVESYVQALQYLPDDEDARHNLEVALRMLRRQQQEQQEQQQRNQDENRNEEQQEQQQEQQQNEEQQEEGREEQQPQEGGEQRPEQQPQPDSTQVEPEPEPTDSTAAPPQLSPEELMKLSKEDAMRILQALEEQEKKLQEERRKAAFRRLKRSGKDW